MLLTYTPGSVMYAMSTGNWSTQPTHGSGNMMAAAVAVKTGIIQQITSTNQLAIQSHIRRFEAYALYITHYIF